MDPVNPPPPYLSPIICNEPSLSAILWACGIVIGIGLILATYDPSSLTFLDFTPSAAEINACYLAGSLVALISCIQLIRLLGGFLTCCNFNASAPDEADKGSTAPPLDTSHDVKSTTSTDVKIAESPLHALLTAVRKLEDQPVWDTDGRSLRSELNGIFNLLRLLRDAKETDAALVSDIITEGAALFRKTPPSAEASSTQQQGFVNFFTAALDCVSDSPSHDRLLKLLKEESEKCRAGEQAFYTAMSSMMHRLMPNALSPSHANLIWLLARHTSGVQLVSFRNDAVTHFKNDHQLAILTALNGWRRAS